MTSHYQLYHDYALLQSRLQRRGASHKLGKKKGGLKVHSVIHANRGVSCNVRFTLAATNDFLMLAPSGCHNGEIVDELGIDNYGLVDNNILF